MPDEVVIRHVQFIIWQTGGGDVRAIAFLVKETAEAFRYFETGSFTGKVVIDISAK